MSKFLFIFCFLGIIGCYSQRVPKSVRKQIKNRFTHKKMHISELIQIDGYYQIDCYYNLDRGHIDTTSFKLVFFDDGSFRTSYLTNPRALRGSFYVCDHCCGIYRIQGDTIIAQTLSANFAKWGNLRWDITEKWYKVIGRQTILCIWMNGKTVPANETYPSQFVPSKDVPSSDCWLKKQDWIWEK